MQVSPEVESAITSHPDVHQPPSLTLLVSASDSRRRPQLELWTQTREQRETRSRVKTRVSGDGLRSQVGAAASVYRCCSSCSIERWTLHSPPAYFLVSRLSISSTR